MTKIDNGEHSVNFQEWSNSGIEYMQERIDKKFPPNKPRNEKEQKKYEAFVQEQIGLIDKDAPILKERYQQVDNNIKNIIASMKRGMSKTEDVW